MNRNWNITGPNTNLCMTAMPISDSPCAAVHTSESGCAQTILTARSKLVFLLGLLPDQRTKDSQHQRRWLVDGKVVILFDLRPCTRTADEWLTYERKPGNIPATSQLQWCLVVAACMRRLCLVCAAFTLIATCDVGPESKNIESPSLTISSGLLLLLLARYERFPFKLYLRQASG